MIRGRCRLVAKFVFETHGHWLVATGLQHLCSKDTVILGNSGNLGRSALMVDADACTLG
jgi:hypothetical protein